MNQLGELLGSSTRGNIVEALALSERPLTAYRVARMYNMNVAKVYIEVKKLRRLGLVKPMKSAKATEYRLADDDLLGLALRLSSRVQTYESWTSDESKRNRFRMGLASVPRVSLDGLQRGARTGQRRMPGELDNLAILGRKKFDSKYLNTRGRDYGRI